MSTVGKHSSEEVVTKYVKNQGKQREYVILHKDQLLLDLGRYPVSLLRGSSLPHLAQIVRFDANLRAGVPKTRVSHAFHIDSCEHRTKGQFIVPNN